MMGKLSVAQMDAHVEELLVGLGAGNDDLTVSRCKRLGQAKARAKFGQITIPLVKSDLSYGTCLHEIGHFRGKRQGSHKVMEREAGAWGLGEGERARLDREDGEGQGKCARIVQRAAQKDRR